MTRYYHPADVRIVTSGGVTIAYEVIDRELERKIRPLVVAHQRPNECDWCDERVRKIIQAIEDAAS